MIVTLTDFGNSEYLGIVKGIIYSIEKKVTIVELNNHISPYNIKEAAWILSNNYKHFPKYSIFLCVVDPTVGSSRQAVAIKTKNFFFVGPDNGIFTEVLKIEKPLAIIKLPTQNASNTFQARDVFAKAAAALESDKNISALGEKTALKFKLEFYLNDRTGEIVRIDHFGNIITNIPHIKNKKGYKIKTKKLQTTMPFFQIYADAPNDTLFLIESSCNTLEFAVKNGSAKEKINLNIGDRISIE